MAHFFAMRTKSKYLVELSHVYVMSKKKSGRWPEFCGLLRISGLYIKVHTFGLPKSQSPVLRSRCVHLTIRGKSNTMHWSKMALETLWNAKKNKELDYLSYFGKEMLLFYFSIRSFSFIILFNRNTLYQKILIVFQQKISIYMKFRKIFVFLAF